MIFITSAVAHKLRWSKESIVRNSEVDAPVIFGSNDVLRTRSLLLAIF